MMLSKSGLLACLIINQYLVFANVIEQPNYPTKSHRTETVLEMPEIENADSVPPV